MGRPGGVRLGPVRRARWGRDRRAGRDSAVGSWPGGANSAAGAWLSGGAAWFWRAGGGRPPGGVTRSGERGLAARVGLLRSGCRGPGPGRSGVGRRPRAVCRVARGWTGRAAVPAPWARREAGVGAAAAAAVARHAAAGRGDFGAGPGCWARGAVGHAGWLSMPCPVPGGVGRRAGLACSVLVTGSGSAQSCGSGRRTRRAFVTEVPDGEGHVNRRDLVGLMGRRTALRYLSAGIAASVSGEGAGVRWRRRSPRSPRVPRGSRPTRGSTGCGTSPAMAGGRRPGWAFRAGGSTTPLASRSSWTASTVRTRSVPHPVGSRARHLSLRASTLSPGLADQPPFREYARERASLVPDLRADPPGRCTLRP